LESRSEVFEVSCVKQAVDSRSARISTMLEGARDEEARHLRYLMVREGVGSLETLEAMTIPGEKVESWRAYRTRWRGSRA
jgi:hypothetical protein